MRSALALGASALALALAATSGAHALPARDDVAAGDSNVDSAGSFAGVGMMYTEAGYVCTGQLINARTVIFAAHCADFVLNADHGAKFGGVGMAFSFGYDALPGFISWFNNGYASNPDMHVYDVIQVQSVFEAGVFNFPGGDIAMATLAIPAIGLPTYGMLFSPHMESGEVSIVGYGRSGNGSNGPTGIDWKRRAGGNMLDGLFTQDDFLGAVFGVAPGFTESVFGPSAGQVLYHIDFDRPDRNENDCTRGAWALGPNDISCNTPPFSTPITFDGTSAVYFSDHMNWFGGGAVDNESGTAGGDSGSGLFMDIGGNRLILGVLSGGWTFTSPNGGYGDLSYYQPLFMYQDWIMANNPMVYAAAVAGDGNWSDANHWMQTLDPNYFAYDENGNLVNGVWDGAPDTVGGGLATDTPAWGVIFDTEVNDYRATGQVGGASAEVEIVANGVGAGNFRGEVPLQDGVSTLSSQPAGSVHPDSVQPLTADDAEARGDTINIESGNFRGEISLAQGVAPQATGSGGSANTGVVTMNINPLQDGWVPNNSWGTYGTWTGPASGQIARFYNVNLANSGRTTVDMNVELDMFNISHSGAVLDVASDYSFNALIAFNQFNGQVIADGTINAREYLLTGGMLSGNGTINTPTLWNVAGVVSPGSSIGTLTINGDYVQTAGGTLFIEFDDTSSDQLVINGDASLDGLLVLSPLSGHMPRWGDDFSFLTANTIIGNFAAVADLPGVLMPVVSIANGVVSVELAAQAFSTQANFTNHFQADIATALDDARSTDYAALADIYGPIDLMMGENLTLALDTLAPYESVMFDRLARSNANALNGALMRQLSSGFSGHSTDEMAVALMSAEQHASGMANTQSLSGTKSLFRRAQATGDGSTGERAFRGFGEIGLIHGTAELIWGTDRTDVQGHFTLLGFETGFAPGWSGGAAFGFANTEADGPASLGQIDASTETAQLSAFASYDSPQVSFSAHVNRASLDNSASRLVMPGTGLGAARTEYDGDSFGAGAVLQFNATPNSRTARVLPSASLEYTSFEFDAGEAVAGDASLDIAAREVESLIARLGSTFDFNAGAWRPMIYLGVAHEFGDGEETYAAAFSNAPTVAFATDSDIALDVLWYEVGVSVEREFANGSVFAIGLDTQIGRDYLRQEIATVSYSMPF